MLAQELISLNEGHCDIEGTRVRSLVTRVCTFADRLETRLFFLFKHAGNDPLEGICEVVIVRKGKTIVLIVWLVLHEQLPHELYVPARVDRRTDTLLIKASLPISHQRQH